jgi:hypothetical protein
VRGEAPLLVDILVALLAFPGTYESLPTLAKRCGWNKEKAEYGAS